MHIDAQLIPEGKGYAIFFPSLDIATQARNDREVEAMASSCLNDLMDRDLGVTVRRDGLALRLHLSNIRGALALLVLCRRQMLGMTQAQLAAKIGAKSATAVARYEQGKTSPSLEVLEKLLAAVGAEIDFLAPALQEV